MRLLERAGILVWVDQDADRGGDNWWDNINMGLVACDLLVLCVTPTALRSRFVKQEYRYFLAENKPVLPVLCDPTTKLPAELRGIQYIPFFEADRLMADVKGKLGLD